MGFRSMEETASEDDRSSSVSSLQDLTRGSGGGGGRGHAGGTLSPQECEDRFGLEVYRTGMDVQIQRLVDSQGPSQVKQWADEGIPVDTMGKPRDMEAFRERQRERPAEVPTDIERRNAKSVQRSKGAHHEASKAGDGQVPDSVRDVISSSGQSLDSNVQRAMEERMGDNLGDVRIHTGPKAAKACQDINARAFTVGNHVAFNRGEYEPSSAEGQHVLAHELAHVRQQTGGAVSMLPKEGELRIDPDEQLEREAEETAQQVLKGGELGIHRMRNADIHIQRAKDGSAADTEGKNEREARQPESSVVFPDSQLQAKFKHADTFGVEGNWNKENKQLFEEALRTHLNDPDTIVISGKYRGQKATHYFNTRTGNNVMTYPDGEFWSTWKLREDQRECLLSTGELGGG